jgi:hypothetical protein
MRSLTVGQFISSVSSVASSFAAFLGHASAVHSMSFVGSKGFKNSCKTKI